MAKKTKRKVSSASAPVAAPEVSEITPVSSANPVRATAANRRVVPTPEFNPDYTYVISDLKRIGTLAGIFFVILIALSFIL